MLNAVVAYLLHFMFVLGGMILFFLPFVTVFYFQNRQSIHLKKPHFNQFMELFFQSKASNFLVLFWAMGEALFWFIIPEFLLLLLIFMRVKRKKQLLIFDIIGTTAGTIVGLLWVLPRDVLLKIPYIFPSMITQVQQWYEHQGIWALFNQPFSGVPYKVFIAEMHHYALPVVAFVLLAVCVRIARYGIAYYLFVHMYPVFHKFVQKHYAILFTAGIAIFTLMLMRVSSIYS
jgi:hypothetical protein